MPPRVIAVVVVLVAGGLATLGTSTPSTPKATSTVGATSATGGWTPPSTRLAAAISTASPASSATAPAAGAAAVPPAPASAGAVPPVPAGYTQVFLDNFDGPAGSAPSQQNWFYELGYVSGNNSVDLDTNSTSNVYLDGNSDLVIQANDVGGMWTSGRLESTRDDFMAPAGGKLEMTASIQQPNVANGTGYWPAFWALGSPYLTGSAWPAVGETDMLEDVNGLNEASQTFHNATGSQGHTFRACPAASCQGAFNTYTVLIDRTKAGSEFLQFLMDGTVETTVTEAQIGTANWQAAINHGYFLLLNMAMGGDYPNSLCNCTSPTSRTTSGGAMKVAYAAVYEQGGNTTPTATVTATGTVTGFLGDCLSNAGSLDTQNNAAILAACDGSAGEQWSLYSDGTVRTQGGCLDLLYNVVSSGTTVVWYPCDGAKTQVWRPQSNGEVLNPSSGLCLTSPGSTAGAALVIQSCTDSPQQQYRLQR